MTRKRDTRTSAYTLRRVPADLWRRAKLYAVEHETTLAAMLIEGIREYLERRGR